MSELLRRWFNQVRGRAWQPGCLGVGRGSVEREEGEEIHKLLRLELFLEIFGHQRQWAELDLLDIVAGNRLDLTALELKDDPLR